MHLKRLKYAVICEALAGDGINAKFEIESPKLKSPETIAKRIFETYRNPKDDAFILMVQLL